MQPLFDPEPYLIDDVAVATLRVFAGPDGNVTRYEVVSRASNGALTFHRINPGHTVFDGDAGYVQAEALLRSRVRELLDSSGRL